MVVAEAHAKGMMHYVASTGIVVSPVAMRREAWGMRV